MVSIEPRPRRNYVLQWNLNVQRELTPNVTALIGYVDRGERISCSITMMQTSSSPLAFDHTYTLYYRRVFEVAEANAEDPKATIDALKQANGRANGRARNRAIAYCGLLRAPVHRNRPSAIIEHARGHTRKSG